MCGAARRQAGSTLKPFLYGLAIENRQLTAASVLDDSPIQLATPTGLYIPQDYDRDFKGPVTVRIAPSGKIHVYSGAVHMGQSTKTMLAQIVAEPYVGCGQCHPLPPEFTGKIE